MTRMPPGPPARCAAYTDDQTDGFFMPGVEEWLTGPDRPSPHGNLTIPGRRGVVYNVGALWEESQRHPEWPAAARRWLQTRNNMPAALVVVWE